MHNTQPTYSNLNYHLKGQSSASFSTEPKKLATNRQSQLHSIKAGQMKRINSNLSMNLFQPFHESCMDADHSLQVQSLPFQNPLLLLPCDLRIF